MFVEAVFLPLISSLIAGFFGKTLGDRTTNFISCAILILAAIMSCFIFMDVALAGNSTVVELLPWMTSGTLEFSWALKFDTLSAVMVFVVLVVSSCVHVYSVGYMHHDKSQPRFMSYLGLFTFAMLMLVTADNLVQMFFGWEGVGLASYLLIGFWYEKESANKAAMKAFLVNRVGDFGFSLGIFAIFMLFGTVQLSEIFAQASVMENTMFTFLGMEAHAMTVICFLLFIGAMGKSAQLGLHTWLPDAMEGPTPVSALIHAATMVTAGVFMVTRMSPLFEFAPDVLTFITFIGATTAFFAASVGLTQNDIKRVIAYSTCSQLGYMFFAIGVSAYSAAIFHLFTHAFFKALLFLGAGSVIHAMSNEQDMRNMGGIWRKIPFTYACMWIGSLALAGIPLFAGYYSKDMILEAAYAAHHSPMHYYAFVLGIISAAMTAFYSWRLIFLTFHGTPRASKKVMSHVHESPPVMTIPLGVLMIGAVFSGFVGYDVFVGHDRLEFWADSIFVLASHDVIEEAHHVAWYIKKLPLLVSLLGIGLAYLMYIKKPSLPGKTAQTLKPLYNVSYNKWYFDEIYDALIVRPLMMAGRFLWRIFDVLIIDGLGPNGMMRISKNIAGTLSRLQTGYVYHYAFVMLVGLVIFISYLFYRILV